MHKVIISTLLLISFSPAVNATDIRADNSKVSNQEQKEILFREKIKSLKNENKELQATLSKVIAQSSRKLKCDGSYVEEYKQEAKLCNNKLLSLKNEIYIQENRDEPQSNMQLQESNSQIVALKLQLKDLDSKYEKLKESNNKPSCKSIQQASTCDSNDLELLKTQNQSLRDTIGAQSKMLIAVDNATKTAERLITENKMLQHQLDQKTKYSKSNAKTAKGLIDRSNKLQNDVIQRDHYINKMLRICDGRDLDVVNNTKADEILSLGKEGDKLKILLDVESKSNKSQLDVIKSLKKELSSGGYKTKSDKRDYYKNSISYLEQGIELQGKELGFLILRNKELNAKIILLLSELRNKQPNKNELE